MPLEKETPNVSRELQAAAVVLRRAAETNRRPALINSNTPTRVHVLTPCKRTHRCTYGEFQLSVTEGVFPFHFCMDVMRI